MAKTQNRDERFLTGICEVGLYLCWLEWQNSVISSKPKGMEIQITSFENLSLIDFHDIIALRIAVFVVEQNCPYQDLDGKDLKSYQVMIRDKKTKTMIGTARILPAGVSYKEVSIGRVASHPQFRNQKVGHVLMKTSMEFIRQHMDNPDIRISAQSYLCKFYAQCGFESTGKEYLEDDIPHTEMIYKTQPQNNRQN